MEWEERRKTDRVNFRRKHCRCFPNILSFTFHLPHVVYLDMPYVEHVKRTTSLSSLLGPELDSPGITQPISPFPSKLEEPTKMLFCPISDKVFLRGGGIGNCRYFCQAFAAAVSLVRRRAASLPFDSDESLDPNALLFDLL